MTPEAADYLRHSNLALRDANAALNAGIFRLAAREAYVAALDAARAIVFEKLRIAPKTHSGTHSLFHQLARDGLEVSEGAFELLSKGLEVKNSADYGPYDEVSQSKAAAFVKNANAFVARIDSELSS